MEIINYLATLISSKIGISSAAARGLIKLSIKDLYGPFFPLSKLTYNRLKTIIEKPLKKRLLELNINNIDDITDLLLSELNKNQSLITIERV